MNKELYIKSLKHEYNRFVYNIKLVNYDILIIKKNYKPSFVTFLNLKVFPPEISKIIFNYFVKYTKTDINFLESYLNFLLTQSHKIDENIKYIQKMN